MTASPQTANGHIRIANELYSEIVRYNFTKRELKVVLAIISKTYGWNKKTDRIALSQISSITGLLRPHIATAVASLVDKKILTKAPGYISVLGLNKDYTKWKGWEEGVTELVPLLPKQNQVLPKQELKCSQNSNATVTKTVPTKDTIQKDTIQDTPDIGARKRFDMFTEWEPTLNQTQKDLLTMKKINFRDPEPLLDYKISVLTKGSDTQNGWTQRYVQSLLRFSGAGNKSAGEVTRDVVAESLARIDADEESNHKVVDITPKQNLLGEG